MHVKFLYFNTLVSAQPTHCGEAYSHEHPNEIVTPILNPACIPAKGSPDLQKGYITSDLLCH